MNQSIRGRQDINREKTLKTVPNVRFTTMAATAATVASFLHPYKSLALLRHPKSSPSTLRLSTGSRSAVSTGRESSAATPTGMINGNYHVGVDDETMIGRRMGLDEFFEMAEQLARSDGGPPRWFAPLECGPPLDNSPLLLYLPGQF